MLHCRSLSDSNSQACRKFALHFYIWYFVLREIIWYEQYILMFYFIRESLPKNNWIGMQQQFLQSVFFYGEVLLVTYWWSVLNCFCSLWWIVGDFYYLQVFYMDNIFLFVFRFFYVLGVHLITINMLIVFLLWFKSGLSPKVISNNWIWKPFLSKPLLWP